MKRTLIYRHSTVKHLALASDIMRFYGCELPKLRKYGMDWDRPTNTPTEGCLFLGLRHSALSCSMHDMHFTPIDLKIGSDVRARPIRIASFSLVIQCYFEHEERSRE